MSTDAVVDGQQKPTFLSKAFVFLKFFGSCISLWGIGYMKFSAAWVAVGSFGYFCIQLARNKRAELTSSIKAIGENEKKFILKNFCVDDLPSWVYFPDVERAEWLNKVIKRLWPYISDYAKEIIIESVAPAVAAQLPSALKPFEFVTLDLGDTPPRVGGVKVYMEESIKRDEVVIDLDLMLYSDARIKVRLGRIKAGVKEFELRGTLRVVMKPLISKIPFTGAVTVCFLNSPHINFTLTDMGNVLGLPGLQQTLNTVIRDVVNQMIVLPNRLPVQLVDNVDVQRLKYPMPQGVLRINVIGARRLKIGDKSLIGGGSSDPYCVIRMGARTFQTSVLQKTLDPEWNEYFETIVDVRNGQSLEIEVYDKDQGNKDDTLGVTSIPIGTVHERGELDTWTKLENVKTGSIHLKLTWFNLSDRVDDMPLTMEQALSHRSVAKATMSACFLYLVVEQANNLRRVKQMREPSAFCNLMLGRDAQSTEVKERTQSPTWESVHHFLIGDPYVDSLQIIVRDSRTEELLGTCTIPVKLLLTQQHMAVSRPFTLKESGPEGATIYLHLELKALIPGQPQSMTNIDGKAKVDATPASTPTVLASPSPPPDSESSDTMSEDPDMLVRNRQEPIQPTIAAEPAVWQSTPTPDADHSPPTNRVSPEKTALNSNGNVLISALGRLRLTLDYRGASGVLSLTVHEASGLRGVDKDGLADPYVNITIVDQHGLVSGEKKKTETIKDSLNPVYEASFEFPVTVDELPTHGLRLDVKNHVGMFTRSGRTHYMGSVFIDLCRFFSSESVSDWFPLVSVDSISVNHNHNHSDA